MLLGNVDILIDFGAGREPRARRVTRRVPEGDVRDSEGEAPRDRATWRRIGRLRPLRSDRTRSRGWRHRPVAIVTHRPYDRVVECCPHEPPESNAMHHPTTRRRFLQTASLAAAAPLVLARPHPAAAIPP